LSKAPFDSYTLSVSVFVIEKATNQSIPIVTIAVGQAPDNFEISSTELETWSSYTYDSGTGNQTIPVPSRIAYIEVKRSQFAQAITMCLFLINWILTTGSICIVALVLSRREKIKEAVLLLPVTIVLTIPTLRNLYPGLPPFGIYIGKSRTLRS